MSARPSAPKRSLSQRVLGATLEPEGSVNTQEREARSCQTPAKCVGHCVGPYLYDKSSMQTNGLLAFFGGVDPVSHVLLGSMYFYVLTNARMT